MNHLQVTARLEIHEGQLEEFKRLQEACIAVVKEKDPGTLQYDWFYNDDNTVCLVRERYENSDAVLAHAVNVGEYLGPLLSISDFSAEFCGNASDALKEALSQFNITYYSFSAGL